jgi:hypothetical protein
MRVVVGRGSNITSKKVDNHDSMLERKGRSRDDENDDDEWEREREAQE